MANNYYTITAEPWDDSTNDTGPEVSAEDLRALLEQLHLLLRPDKASQIYTALLNDNWTPFEVRQYQETMEAVTGLLDGVADQIDKLEEAEA